MIIIRDARGAMIGIACQRWPRDDAEKADEGDAFVIPEFLRRPPLPAENTTVEPATPAPNEPET